MAKTTDGGPAFPLPGEQFGHVPRVYGMSLRDYFAAQAMAGILASPNCPTGAVNTHIAEESYAMADAMLAERAK